MALEDVINPKPYGPTAMPAQMSPTMAGRCKRRHINGTNKMIPTIKTNMNKEESMTIYSEGVRRQE